MGEGGLPRSGDGGIGEFHRELAHQICYEYYAEKRWAEATSFGKASEDFYSFFFFDARVQDSQCDSVETGTEVVP